MCLIKSTNLHKKRLSVQTNKLKSLKVAQVKDEMDGDEDDGCEVVWWCCVTMLCDGVVDGMGDLCVMLRMVVWVIVKVVVR